MSDKNKLLIIGLIILAVFIFPKLGLFSFIDTETLEIPDCATWVNQEISKGNLDSSIASWIDDEYLLVEHPFTWKNDGKDVCMINVMQYLYYEGDKEYTGCAFSYDDGGSCELLGYAEDKCQITNANQCTTCEISRGVVNNWISGDCPYSLMLQLNCLSYLKNNYPNEYSRIYNVSGSYVECKDLEQEIDNPSELFPLVDRNFDGCISEEEYDNFVFDYKLGVFSVTLIAYNDFKTNYLSGDYACEETNEILYASEVFDLADTNNDDCLSTSEFLTMQTKFNNFEYNIPPSVFMYFMNKYNAGDYECTACSINPNQCTTCEIFLQAEEAFRQSPLICNVNFNSCISKLQTSYPNEWAKVKNVAGTYSCQTTPECSSGEKQCLSTSTYKTCLSSEKWSSTLTCPTGTECSNNQCNLIEDEEDDECSVNEKKCISDSKYKTCVNGEWSSEKSCETDEYCSSGLCKQAEAESDLSLQDKIINWIKENVLLASLIGGAILLFILLARR